MPHVKPLPSSLNEQPFAIGAAHDLGVSPSRLRASDLVIPTRGVRTTKRRVVAPDASGETASERMLRLKADLRRRAFEFAPALTPDQFFSGPTGLALLGAPIPFTAEEQLDLHVAARHPAGKPRRGGTVGHRLGERDPARLTVDGLPIEDPARLWTQAAKYWQVDDLIAAGDHLVLPRRRLITLSELEAEAAASASGNLRVQQAIPQVREGSESPQETELRLVVVRAGLPEPELNWDLRARDGRFIARLDLAWPYYRVATEYDGRVHAEDDQQFARDADRWDEIKEVDWNLVRVLSHHLRPRPQIALDRISRALFQAGWRPGRA